MANPTAGSTRLIGRGLPKPGAALGLNRKVPLRVLCLEADLAEVMLSARPIFQRRCDELGHDQLDNLAMSYKTPDGSFETVTRAVTMAALRAAPVLRLAPASRPPPSATKRGSKAGPRTANGRSVKYGRV